MSRHFIRHTFPRLAASALITLSCWTASAAPIFHIIEANNKCPESSLQIAPRWTGNTIISFTVSMVRADNKQEVQFFPKCSGTSEQIHCPKLDERGPAYVHFSQGGMKASDVESVQICVGARYYEFIRNDPRNKELSGSFSCTPYVRIGTNGQFNVPRIGTGPSATIDISTKAFSENRSCNSIKVEVFNIRF